VLRDGCALSGGTIPTQICAGIEKITAQPFTSSGAYAGQGGDTRQCSEAGQGRHAHVAHCDNPQACVEDVKYLTPQCQTVCLDENSSVEGLHVVACCGIKRRHLTA